MMRAVSEIAPDWRCPLCEGAGEGRVILRSEHRFHDRPSLRYSLIACARCGLQRLDPIPSPEDLAALYDPQYSPYGQSLNDAGTMSRRLKMAVGRIASSTSRDAVAGIPAKVAGVVVRTAELLAGHVLPLTTRFPLSLAQDAPMIDFGAGAGGWVRSMRKAGYRKVWAYDIPHAGLDSMEAEGVPVLRAPGPLPERSFACVRLEHSLEHVPDPVAVLKEVARSLLPGGSAVIALPNVGSRTARAMGDRWPALTVPHHLSHFTERSLRLLAGRAGLDLVEVQPIPYWEIGWAAERASNPRLASSPGRAWRARYMVRCAADGEGDCIAVRMLRRA